VTQKPFLIALVGLGTVGAGVVKLLDSHAGLIAARAGRAIEIAAVAARDRSKARGIDLNRFTWSDDPLALVRDDTIDAIVELVGGAEGFANTLVRAALAAGKPVVTANKALLALHGFELAKLAEENNAPLLFEAAVAGGIPIIKTLREGLAGNEVRSVYGILNGTCNYILTEMRETGKDFAEVLRTAQILGYAEADPAFDIDGIDAAHKLCILSALAFGHRPDFASMQITGISGISARDITFADELGYRIKLLGIARRIDGRIMQRVEPCLVPTSSPMGAVEGVFNAVFTDSDFADRSLSIGRGAGEKPTASAVASDLIDLTRGHALPVFGMPAGRLAKAAWVDEGSLVSDYYMHMTVLDKPGVLADISAILRDHAISIESLLQRGRDPGNPVSIVMTTHPTKARNMREAVKALEGLATLVKSPCVLRIETF
jgi:homoserine dehydrogenase